VPSKLERHADQLGALGHPVRLSIVRYVVQGGAEGTSAGLLVSRREGTFIYYRADYDALKTLTDYLWEDCCKRGKNCC
jgi:ArsR family transcriptional regulator, arsenate/arsenite/antimonite-responsive transcriptional repressor